MLFWKFTLTLLIMAHILFAQESAPTTTETDVPQKVLFLLDCSLSMQDEVDAEQTKFQGVQRVLAQIWKNLGESHQIGLMAFGHNVPNSNPVGWDKDFGIVVPIADYTDQQLESLNASLSELLPTGSTPAVGAMTEGLKQLQKHSDTPGLLIVITDGSTQDGGAQPGHPNVWQRFDDRLADEQIVIVAYNIMRDSEKTKFEKYREEAEKREIVFKEATTTDDLLRTLEAVLDLEGNNEKGSVIVEFASRIWRGSISLKGTEEKTKSVSLTRRKDGRDNPEIKFKDLPSGEYEVTLERAGTRQTETETVTVSAGEEKRLKIR